MLLHAQVTVALNGPVNSSVGASLPLQPLTFWRVKHALVTTLSSGLSKTPAMPDNAQPIPGYSDAVCM